jgi:hypothetical protein
MYRLFDGAVACDFPLSGVPAAQRDDADLQLKLGSGVIDEAGFVWFHNWREADGKFILSCARKRAGNDDTHHLLRFPKLADFLISDSSVTCYPRPGCSEDSLNHLLLDQIIPRIWAHYGHLVLHASAVQLASGHIIAFLGESGWGKSTLVAALQARGGRLLSDDSVHLRVCAGVVQVIPCYPGLRLNADSIIALGIEEQDWNPVCHYSGKQRFVPDEDEGSDYFSLDSLYIMAGPGKAQALSIQELSGVELITTLIKRSFLLDVKDSHCAIRQIREAGAVLRALPQVYGLDYPRDFRQLPAVCDALIERALL